jgi:hypothetical protein
MAIDAEKLVEILQRSPGRARGLHVYEIAELLDYDRDSKHAWRQIRAAIKILRLQGWPICAHPADGYYWATEVAELEGTIAFLRDRALSSLSQISRLKKIAIPLLCGQAVLPLLVVDGLPQPEDFNYSRTPRISTVVEIPETLLRDLRSYLAAHPEDSRDTILSKSLEMFLLANN